MHRFVDVARDYPPYTRAYAYDDVGKHYRNRGDYHRATEMFEQCVAAFPGSSRFHLQLGAVYLARADAGERALVATAEEHLRESVRIDPNNVPATDLLARLLLKERRTEDLARLYRDLVEADPSNAQYWEGLGHASMENGDFASAERAFRAVLSRRPEAPVRRALGTTLMSSGRFPEAAGVLAEGLARGEVEGPLQATLAACRVEAIDLLVRSGRTPDPEDARAAVASVRALLERDPTDTTALALAERLRELVWRPGKD